MFKLVGILLLVGAFLSFLFDWGVEVSALTFGLGMLAIGVVLNRRPA